MYAYPELLFSVSVAVYVTVSVIVGVLRWGHKCEPYASHIDYYYPGWRTIAFGFISNVNLIPVILMPTDADCIFLLKNCNLPKIPRN